MTHRLVVIGFLGFGLSVLGSALAVPLTRVSVEVTGGAYEGSYTRDSPDTNCMVGSGGGDKWEATVGTDVPEPGGLSLFMLTVPHSGMSSSTGSATITDFSLFVGFGEYGGDGYTEYALEPASSKGSGSLSLTQTDRKHAQLAVTGQTAEGVTLSATLTCNDVLDMSGRALSASEFGELNFAPDSASPVGSLELALGDATYTVQTGEEGSCTSGMTQAGDLWYEYYPGEGYTDVLLITDNLESAKSGTSVFGFSIDLSPIHQPGDAGTLTVTQTGDHLTLVADAQTSDGVPVKVTAVCPLP